MHVDNAAEPTAGPAPCVPRLVLRCPLAQSPRRYYGSRKAIDWPLVGRNGGPQHGLARDAPAPVVRPRHRARLQARSEPRPGARRQVGRELWAREPTAARWSRAGAFIGTTTTGLCMMSGVHPGASASPAACSAMLRRADRREGLAASAASAPSAGPTTPIPAMGICSTATIEDDRVYIVSNRGEVLCLDMAGMANGNDGPFVDERHLLAGWTRARQPQPAGRAARRLRRRRVVLRHGRSAEGVPARRVEFVPADPWRLPVCRAPATVQRAGATSCPARRRT